MDESIAKHTSPLEDEEQGYLIRQALAASVLNRANRTNPAEPPSDNAVEEELVRIPRRVFSATNARALLTELQSAIAEAIYSHEELEL